MKRWWSREPLVSVVVPAFGVERWIDECLGSLVRQQHTRWEAVVVDDGSTDRTGEIADAWARRDHRITVVHPPTPGSARPATPGWPHVRGDYLAFLDSDDLLQPTAYATSSARWRVGLRLRDRLDLQWLGGQRRGRSSRRG